MNLVGLILDGARKVGEFESATSPDSQGFRDLKKVRLVGEYMDIARGHSNQHLTFAYATQGDDTYMVVDVLGHGMIFDPQSTWCRENVVELDEAKFVVTFNEESGYLN